MRTPAEILKRLKAQEEDKYHSLMWAASEYHPLCLYLPEYIKEGYEPDPLTREHVVSGMEKYLPFAYMKAMDERGLSANRSIWKYQEWLWVLEDPLSDEIEDYSDYGIPQLEKIAKKYGFTWPPPPYQPG